jgi:hypothetical protein
MYLSISTSHGGVLIGLEIEFTACFKENNTFWNDPSSFILRKRIGEY